MNDNRATVMDEHKDTVQDKPGVDSSNHEKPNLTLLEKGQNPGDLLKSAREKLGLSIAEIRALTKINERQIEALEGGDLALLPTETFAKAFIKSYCKVLKIDHAPVIAAYGFADSAPVVAKLPVSRVVPVSQPATPAAGRAELSEPSMPSSSKRLSSIQFEGQGRNRSLGFFVILGVAVVAAVFYLPALMKGNSERSDAQVLSEGQGMPPPAPVLENPAPAVPLVPSAEGSSQLAVTGQLGQLTPSAADGAAPATTPATPLALTPSSALVPAPVAAAPVPAPVAVSTQPPAVGQSTLKFGFADQSWVTVRDASNAVLMSQLNQPGSNVDVVGQGPFKVIVGNAKAVTLTHNGKPIDLASSVRGEVARLTIQ